MIRRVFLQNLAAALGDASPDVGGGNAYPRYQNVYNNLIITESPMTIEQSLMIDANHNYILQANVVMTGDLDTSNNKIVFIITRYLSDSYFSSVAVYEYEDFNLTTAGEEQLFTFQLPLNSEWQFENLKVATIIQTYDDYPDANRHKIFQAEMAEFTDLLAPITIDNLDFGDVEIGNSSTKIMTISNFFDNTLSGQIFPVLGFDVPTSFEIPPFSSEDIEVTFTPENEQTYTGQLIIFTNHESYPSFIVDVNGNGVPNSAQNEENIPVNGAYLSRNYPNPFNPTTSIEYYTTDKNATIEIFNIKGQTIKEYKNLRTREQTIIHWDGKDDKGKTVPSGLYYYKLTGEKPIIKKMILMK